MSEKQQPTTMFVVFGVPESPYPLAPQELPEPPRAVEFRLTSRVFRGIALAAFFIVPNVILCFGLVTVQPLLDLEASGQATQALLTSRYTTPGSKGRTLYWVRYCYNVDGKPYPLEVPVSEEEYARRNEGDPLAVTYLPSDPGLYCLGKPGDHLQQEVRLILIWTIGTALALAGGFLYQHISMTREMYLACNGVAVLGQVTGKDKTRIKNGFRYWVHYAFEPHGWALRNGTKELSWDVWQYLCPRLGVTVLYLPENPDRFQLLCGFDHVRFLPAEGPEVETCRSP
jgi:hypothetical protein